MLTWELSVLVFWQPSFTLLRRSRKWGSLQAVCSVFVFAVSLRPMSPTAELLVLRNVPLCMGSAFLQSLHCPSGVAVRAGGQSWRLLPGESRAPVAPVNMSPVCCAGWRLQLWVAVLAEGTSGRSQALGVCRPAPDCPTGMEVVSGAADRVRREQELGQICGWYRGTLGTSGEMGNWSEQLLGPFQSMQRHQRLQSVGRIQCWVMRIAWWGRANGSPFSPPSLEKGSFEVGLPLSAEGLGGKSSPAPARVCSGRPASTSLPLDSRVAREVPRARYFAGCDGTWEVLPR